MGNQSSQLVTKEFTNAKILTDVFPTAPKDLLYVAYKTSKGRCVLKIGELVSVPRCYTPPKVHWEFCDDELYTLCLVDPDYPTNENRKDAEKLYWLVINIPKNHICDGKSLVPYLGCRPGLNTGLHRYVFLVFRQNERLDITDPIFDDRVKRRYGFSIYRFAITYNLGDPIAGIFYWSKLELEPHT